MRNRLRNRSQGSGSWLQTAKNALLLVRYWLLAAMMSTVGCREKKQNQMEELKITRNLSNLTRPTNVLVASDIPTVMPVRKEMEIVTEANGVIGYDSRRASIVAARVAGRIEKLYVKYNFQEIRKGQKLMDIYSPELVTAQEELIYLLQSDPGRTDLLEGVKHRLHQLGLTDAQISQLTTTRKASYAFPMYSAVDGYVTEVSTDNNQGELSVREGNYINVGESVFKVIDTKQVWAEFEIYQKDAGHITVNDPVEIQFQDLTMVKARLNVIQPFVKTGERFVKVRCYLDNRNGNLAIGQLVRLRVSYLSKNALWIPASSVVNLGTQKIVFVKKRGMFRSRAIVAGEIAEDWVNMLGGVEASDSIALQASYLVDSEGFITITK